VAVEVAGQISPAPSIDQVEAERAALRRMYYRELEGKLEKALYEAFNEPGPGPDMAQTRAIRARIMDEAYETIREAEQKLLDDYRLKQLSLLTTAEYLARISPTACATFALNRLSVTDVGLHERFLVTLSRFREEYTQFAEEKIRQNPELSSSGISTSVSSTDDDEGNVQLSVDVQTPSQRISVDGMPRYSVEEESFESVVTAALVDVAILSLEFIIFFIISFTAFLRYDVR
jgi:hypothetical protein